MGDMSIWFDMFMGRAEIRNLPMIVIGDMGFFVSEYLSIDRHGAIVDRHVMLGGRVENINCLPYIPMEHFRVRL